MSSNGYGLEIQLQKLKNKISSILVQHKNQQTTIAQLQQENKELKQQINGIYKSGRSKSDDSLAGGAVRTSQELQQRIDSYISDIDQSITYFEQLQSWESSQ